MAHGAREARRARIRSGRVGAVSALRRVDTLWIPCDGFA
jgi:hypothetical protein